MPDMYKCAPVLVDHPACQRTSNRRGVECGVTGTVANCADYILFLRVFADRLFFLATGNGQMRALDDSCPARLGLTNLR